MKNVKLIGAIAAVVLGLGSYFLGADLKAAVCGAPVVDLPAAPAAE